MGGLTLGGVYLKAMVTCGRLATWASRIVFEETCRQVDTLVSFWSQLELKKTKKQQHY